MLIIDCIYEIKQIDKEIQLLNYVKQNYKNNLLYDEKEEMKEYFDDNKIDFSFNYKFKNKRKYKIRIKCKKILNNTS